MTGRAAALSLFLLPLVLAASSPLSPDAKLISPGPTSPAGPAGPGPTVEDAGGGYTYLGFVWHLERPYAELPEAMTQGAYAVWWCESRMDDQAIGSAGERGVPQVHPVHAKPMAAAGLDFRDGADRMRYAVRLWERQGWGPWSCSR